ncbi:MAG: hypothetical protein PHD54_13295 [Desulfuromonadaceae bacterium]|nr:hypothetical protein [Desulfuromonadaceae bacterium]
MTSTCYEQVCYRTEQREESVQLRNLKSGQFGYSFGCTQAGETVQVRLTNGDLDSWDRSECVEAFSEAL